MKIHRKGSFGGSSRSLTRQIVLVETRLDRRKVRAREAALSLGSRFLSDLASAKGLWIAGCAGFLLADWVHRPKIEATMAAKQPTAAQRKPSAPVSRTLPLVKLLLDLTRLWLNANTGSVRPRAR